jgi:hypothetical protein
MTVPDANVLIVLLAHNGLFISAKQKPIMNTIANAMASSPSVIFVAPLTELH